MVSPPAIAHSAIKKPIVDALFNSTELTNLIGQDSEGNESIYEGWHIPERVQVNYPYITYRIDWFPSVPTGFLNGLLTLDTWDTAPMGNDASLIEDICTTLTFIYDAAILIDAPIIVRCKIQSDLWIQEEEPNHIHRQVIVTLRTIDLYGSN
jgi:hypothetical protein